MSRSHCVNGFGIIFLIYVSTYLGWSRYAAGREQERGSDGNYFFDYPGRNSAEWSRRESLIRMFYAPCLYLDVTWFGGESPSCEPLNDLSEYQQRLKSRILSHDDLAGGQSYGCT